MIKALLVLIALSLATPAFAQVYVNPYLKKDGTFVQGHIRSAPDQFKQNNYGYRQNYAQPSYLNRPYAAPQGFNRNMYQPPVGYRR